jgi:hypothetical protein
MSKLSEFITMGTWTLMIGFAAPMLMACNAETTDEAGGETGMSETGDSGDGDGDSGDGDGDSGNDDPYDPHACESPSQVLGYPGLEGAFCSSPCAVDEDCPPGPAETAPSCALADDRPTAELCVLICDPTNDTCPNTATCMEIPDNPDTGLCTYPWP